MQEYNGGLGLSLYRTLETRKQPQIETMGENGIGCGFCERGCGITFLGMILSVPTCESSGLSWSSIELCDGDTTSPLFLISRSKISTGSST
ncbi:hypothetical protein Tco_0591634, partial [Tanacetum coccineum]